MKRNKNLSPDKISSYFREEWFSLSIVTISGLIYNVGLLATPYFEGEMAQGLSDILNGKKNFSYMAILVSIYLGIVLLVQVARYFKRFYVRRFSNNINRNMKGVLYANLLRKSKSFLEEEGNGEIMTKAISDVDDCAEGMRKFTTEIFDTGISFISFAVMLFIYDWRLAFLSLSFTPLAYLVAALMKKPINQSNRAYKKVVTELNSKTLDRASNAVTYRIYGVENVREEDYKNVLKDYEKKAVRNNVWQSALSPLYLASTTAGVFFILYFGSKNVLGTGWNVWDIAALTTFLSCFAKLSLRTSKVAKLFNSVQKAEISWNRIKPLMKKVEDLPPLEIAQGNDLVIKNLSFGYTDKMIFENISLTAKVGDIIGVTGPIAGGKSSFGKAFLLENEYKGSIKFGDKELSSFSPREISGIVGYLGHDPELNADSIRNNVLFGKEEDVMPYLSLAMIKDEVLSMEDKENTIIGSNGIRLSGGQAQRVALARAFANPRPIMILDDPFSALDRNTEDKAFANLKEFAKDKIVILISHRLYHFPEVNKVIYMEKGKNYIGTHKELISRLPQYRNLYESQMGGNNGEK